MLDRLRDPVDRAEVAATSGVEPELADDMIEALLAIGVVEADGPRLTPTPAFETLSSPRVVRVLRSGIRGDHLQIQDLLARIREGDAPTGWTLEDPVALTAQGETGTLHRLLRRGPAAAPRRSRRPDGSRRWPHPRCRRRRRGRLDRALPALAARQRPSASSRTGPPASSGAHGSPRRGCETASPSATSASSGSARSPPTTSPSCPSPSSAASASRPACRASIGRCVPAAG